MFNTPLQARLDLQEYWINDLPLKFLWSINFTTRTGESVTSLGKKISKVIDTYERGSSSKWPVRTNLIDNQSDRTNRFGYLFARSIGFPTESFAVTTEPIENSGGYIQGFVSADRSGYGSQNKLDITFLETNTDVIDYFIKPWIIACSHKGLIEDGNQESDLKCHIQVMLFTRDKSTYKEGATIYNPSVYGDKSRSLQPRKLLQFYNAVPFNVAGDSISYNELSEGDVSKTVSFAFSHYDTTVI